MVVIRGIFYAFLASLAVILLVSIFVPDSVFASFLKAEMAPIMFFSLVVFLLLGYPVAFSLAALGLLYGIVGIELGLFKPSFFQALPNRLFGIIENMSYFSCPHCGERSEIFSHGGARRGCVCVRARERER